MKKCLKTFNLRIIAAVFFLAGLLLSFPLHGVKNAGAMSYSDFVHGVNRSRQVGNQDASVTIIIYTDFQCYWCRKFEEYDLPYIMSHYVKTGKVLLQFRDFPLTLIHQYALKAAEYADCSAYYGKYMPVRKLLYKDQGQWTQIGDLYYFLKTKAGRIVDIQRVQECVKSGIAKKLIKNNRADGMDAGVKGTPTLFIYKGLILYKHITGYKSLREVRNAIEGALR